MDRGPQAEEPDLVRHARLDLCFELVSPLHAGFLPGGSGTFLARTRCYVPGKNLWAAATAGLTPRLHCVADGDDFVSLGDILKRQIIFSYFFLADNDQLFTPDYRPGGLHWGSLSDREFRAHFVASRLSTAIGDAGVAKDETLHELEFIADRPASTRKPSDRTLLAGTVWIRTDERLKVRGRSVFWDEIDLFDDIVVGGERNYGFGRLRRVVAPAPVQTALGSVWPHDPAAGLTLAKDCPLPAHTAYLDTEPFVGEIEIMSGREYPRLGRVVAFQQPGGAIVGGEMFFAPGTRLIQGPTCFSLDPWGRLSPAPTGEPSIYRSEPESGQPGSVT